MLHSINLPIIAPLFIINLLLVVVALVNLARIEHTRGPKILWVFIILFVSTIGPILYFVIGRRNE